MAKPSKAVIGKPLLPASTSASATSLPAQGLSRLLADTYTLYLTTHNFHWN
jgi:starvation-inducible DNA-binding protein